MNGSAARVIPLSSTTPASTSRNGWALVLGGGGTVGMAWHAGTLAAMEEAGWDLASAGLVVGTSAGAVIAGYLTTGCSAAEIADAVADRHPTLPGLSELQLLRAASSGPLGLARRAAGVTLVTSRLAFRWATVPSPRWLAAALPGGFCDPTPFRTRLHTDLAGAIPSRLRVVTFDLTNGRRLVAGDPDDELAGGLDLGTAVSASCCVPGVFPAVEWDGRWLVDGGVDSFTHADLASGYGEVVVASPMAFDPADQPSRGARSVRRLPGAITGREVATLRAEGSDVTWLRPTAAEVELHGAGLLRTGDLAGIVDAAFEATSARLSGRVGDPDEEAADVA